MTQAILGVVSKIGLAFNKIGKSNGTTQPLDSSNTFPLAWEYFVAHRLKGMAEKRLDDAKKACASAGMLGDRAAFVAGTTVQTYGSDLLSINARTSQPAERLDKAKLRSELVKEFGIAKTDNIIKKSTVYNAAAVTYEFSINAE